MSGLSPAKRALLEKRLRGEFADNSKSHFIPRRPDQEVMPLSFAQERFWFLNQLEPGNPAYNRPLAIFLTGSLNVPALEQSLSEILRRHDVLRATFFTVEGQPVQIINPAEPLKLLVVDLSEVLPTERESQIKGLATEEAKRPFDLTQGPLLRATLLRQDKKEHVLLLVTHHIMFDGWSANVLIREIAALYEAFSTGSSSPLPKLPIQYADFAHWQRQFIAGKVVETQLSYWQQQLDGSPPVLGLPTDHPRPPVQTFRGATQSLVCRKSLSESLKDLSRQEGVTLFMTLLAAFQTLLHRHTGQQDIIVGSPIAGRNWVETEGLIGAFINTLVLRTDLSDHPTFRELLLRVRDVALGAYAHQDLPFEKLVEELQPERDPSYTPLFQVMFQLRNVPKQAIEVQELRIDEFEFDSGIAPFDLTLEVVEKAEGLFCLFNYNTDLFDATTIQRMLGHFQTLLQGIVANPDQRLSSLPLLTKAERHQLLVEWNDTHADYPKDLCIHQLFEAQVERTPDAVAVVFEEHQLTYRELNARANQLAHYLRKRGVGPEVLVGICMERSLEMVVGLLGILKAGGAYVPLDPAYPKARLGFMLEDAEVSVLLTQERLLTRLPNDRARVVCLDTGWEAIVQQSEKNPISGVIVGNLAYIIYTSGSTGRPKGVAIEHCSTVALLGWTRKVFAPEHLVGVLASTSICFDLSVFELFVPLSWGGKVILTENLLQLPTLPVAADITLINTVPSAITELLRVGSIPASVCRVNLAGEPLQKSLVKQIYQQGSIQQVFDLYGPSEDTTYSTFALRSESGPDTIGRPIANTQIYLVDGRLEPVPIGVSGELCIGGDGLARGYLNRPELTAEKFIPDPFSEDPEARLYRTGDLARYLPDGNIEFLGRIDRQVKVRGFRIELEEIEAVLAQHPGVRETVVLAREDVPGDKRLVAYLVACQQPVLTPNNLRDFLREKLPEYMVPSVFVVLDAFPLTPNGKVDRRALPAPDNLRPNLETAYVAPRTEVERTIATLWGEVLRIEKVGTHDNFFDLGGHSLLLVKVHTKLQDFFDKEISIVDLFKYPTLNALAKFISEEKGDQSSFQQSDDWVEKLNEGKNRLKQLYKHSQQTTEKRKGDGDE